MFYFTEPHLLSCQATMQFAVCAFLWPTATRFILGCYYHCKYNTTFTEKAVYFPQLGFSSLPFTFDPQPHSAAHGDYIRMLQSRCLFGEPHRRSELGGSYSPREWVRMLSDVQSFWQQFLNILIPRTPGVKKITTRTPSRFVPRFAIMRKNSFCHFKYRKSRKLITK